MFSKNMTDCVFMQTDGGAGQRHFVVSHTHRTGGLERETTRSISPSQSARCLLTPTRTGRQNDLATYPCYNIIIARRAALEFIFHGNNRVGRERVRVSINFPPRSRIMTISSIRVISKCLTLYRVYLRLEVDVVMHAIL